LVDVNAGSRLNEVFMSRQDDIKKLVHNYSRRLQILKEQQALRGINTPPEIVIEIEDIEAKIEKLQTELVELENMVEPSPQIKSTISGSASSESHSKQWDAFISHASEDKDEFVRPLVAALQAEGLRIWYDEFTLTVGDSLRRSIDEGLLNSRYSIVILSPHFLQKGWTQHELDGLLARQIGGQKVILPVWHNITRDELMRYSPSLADKLGVSSAQGMPHVVRELLRAMQR
jgi:hypothetical protein